VRATKLGLAPPYPLSNCDRGIIESALAAPGIGWGGEGKYPDLPSKAAVLLYALAKSQACLDGNKRVALILTSVFVRMNRGYLDATHGDTEAAVLRAAESEAAQREDIVQELTEWMREHLVESEAT
jgi:death on curing protein